MEKISNNFYTFRPEIKYKSIMIIGDIKINNTKKFNWFYKKMWKILLDIDIIDVGGE